MLGRGFVEFFVISPDTVHTTMFVEPGFAC
jgi:hypothetical protein